ncbi:MAG TPA: ABC transporter ATP-binding protein [Cellulomonas sp.]
MTEGAGQTDSAGQDVLIDAHDGITVRGLHRSFGAVHALAGVDLDARPGRVTALIGPNGSGKTTLLLVLAGLLVPHAGHVRVGGFDPVTDGPRARARTGWMPDTFGTWDSLTAREVLLTFAAAYRLPRAAAEARVSELLETVHLSEFADRPASVLSRGQKQRLGLARALVHSPDVLLLDEPASGLDPRSRVDLRLLLRSLAAGGTTVLVSSHVLSELDELVDDAVFLSGGRTVTAGTLVAAESARRSWRVRALSLVALTSWLTSVGAVWHPDADDSPAPTGFGPPRPTPDGPGGVLVDIADEAGAARLVRDAVTAGVALTSIAPAGGALEQAYLALDEERR